MNPSRLLALFSLALALTAAYLAWREYERRIDAEFRLAYSYGHIYPAPPPLPAPPKQPTPEALAPSRTPGSRQSVDIQPYLKMIDDLRQKTQELDRELLASQSSLARAEARLAEQTEASEKALSQLRDLREESQQNRRLAEVYEAELKAKSQRLLQAETAEKLMQQRVEKAEQTARRAGVASRDAEDISRRRESLVSSLQRRFREVTDLYRAFSLQAQNRSTPGASLEAGDLSRLQTTLQQAEDEIEQLRTLNRRMADLARNK